MDYANLSLAPMLIGLAGALALFLHGMTMMSNVTRAVSPSAEGLALAEQLAYEVPRQVANVHLIVNLSTVLILLPFVNLPTALERALTESLRGAYSLTRRFVRVGSGLVHMPAQDA